MPSTDFDQLFQAAESRLVSWCHLRVPPVLRARLDPEDIVQECWIRAKRTFDQYDAGRASFSTWLIGIARRVTSESMRKVEVARVRAEPFDSTQDGGRVRGGFSSRSLRGRLAQQEAFVRLLESLQSLPAEEQELIARLGIEKATCAEVATSWGSTEDAISKRWQRLRARLAETPSVREFLDVEG